MPKSTMLSIAAAALAASGGTSAAPLLLSPEWAAQACSTWNADPVLTRELAKSKWIANDKGRGYKIVQVYRSECENSVHAELRLAQQDGIAKCVYGGKAQLEADQLDYDADYVMHAQTRRWQEMGRGEYGAMTAMMSGRLKFDGPMFEAMNNMSSFQSFLLLVGKVPGDAQQCASEK